MSDQTVSTSKCSAQSSSVRRLMRSSGWNNSETKRGEGEWESVAWGVASQHPFCLWKGESSSNQGGTKQRRVSYVVMRERGENGMMQLRRTYSDMLLPCKRVFSLPYNCGCKPVMICTGVRLVVVYVCVCVVYASFLALPVCVLS
ncbi:unnamed protein product [Musa hybrid cultivar]